MKCNALKSYNIDLNDSVAFRPFARQRPRKKQLDKGRYSATARILQQSSDIFCAVYA
jgi:hypothetical protein